MVNCTKCNRIIFTDTEDGGYKLRSRMVIFRDNKAYALCPTCKTSIPVPIQVSPTIEAKDRHKLVVKI